ncbi:hypothetical protein K3G39_03610 [Pontibacter sp. HSC-14F20]|uniref:hypothetical protein n=1 Tax=Pontibacter sp. HSC-14F20 TaxID=2864136 RepID=UPI001C7320D1|nr:hypothetical protein [Pontibacter sp. HSC-14F20]MBX0332315.1 hypothetical protein [Pontibacter sp. HSC-14F20]
MTEVSQKPQQLPQTGQDTLVRARIALGYSVLVAMLGLFLRWLMVSPVTGVNFKYFLHAHSHVALLGWLYCAFFAALLYIFPVAASADRKSFRWQFFLTQVSVLGMLFTFPVQGYALFSIIFSTMHILLSYWFARSYWKHVQLNVDTGTHATSLKYIGVALLFMVVSSIGPWAMGPIMAKGTIGGELYYSAIYFYLHFQYNGWFTFAVLGLLFWFLEHHQVYFNRSWAMRAFWLLALACLPAYALSVLWTKPADWVYAIGYVSVAMQLGGLLYLTKVVRQVWVEALLLLKPWVRALVGMALVFFVLKLALQTASAFPYMADLAYKLRYFIIGYLHLSLLGFVSLFVLAFLLQQGLYQLGRYGGIGLTLFLAGFFCTELMLFGQGTLLWLGLMALPSFNWLMFWASVPMPLGLALFFLGQRGLQLPHRTIA